MKYVSLFRPVDEGEFDDCRTLIPTFTSRMIIPENSIVIAKYSIWPYSLELQKDLDYRSSDLINSPDQINHINTFWDWYYELEAFTAPTYMTVEELPKGKSFILKGQTKSKKDKWFTHCFAKNKADAKKVYARLEQDSYIMAQGGIIIREALDLKKIGVNRFTNRPLFEEWRCFIHNGKIISTGFYNKESLGMMGRVELPNEAREFVEQVIAAFKTPIPFYTIDIAKLSDDKTWKLIELNEGQMATLMGNDARDVYGHFAALNKKEE
jgi:hypothetical protein